MAADLVTNVRLIWWLMWSSRATSSGGVTQRINMKLQE
jgi:hypothetical protein